MTGYFSQLARHTGIDLQPAPSVIGGSVVTGPAALAESPRTTLPAALDVEEITFTAAPESEAREENREGVVSASTSGAKSSPDRDRSEAGTMGGSSPAPTESHEDHHPLRAPATPQRVIDVPPAEPLAVQRAERQPPQESIEIPGETIALVERQSAALGPWADDRLAPRPDVGVAEKPQRTPGRAPADVVGQQHFEREILVHKYLNEVQSWVAAPAEEDRGEGERQLEAQERLAKRSETLVLEPNGQLTAPRPSQPTTLEAQDLSLSIGTISIVIEEPKQTAATPLTPPKVERLAEGPATEPTRLSRYYLEPW